MTVYYDAWLNDNDIDPLLSIIYEISKIGIGELDRSNNSGFFDSILAAADAVSGRNIKVFFESLAGSNPLEIIDKQKNIDESISEFLNAIIPENGERLIVFVDELDRCRPSFAVQLLERIKHYFDNDKITFVFSINTNELKHSVQHCYGEHFDADRYLDRFFDLRISLPPANMDQYLMSMGFNVDSYTFDNMCRLVISYCGMGLREAEKYMRVAFSAAYEATHGSVGLGFDDTKGYDFCYMVMLPIVIGLGMTDRSKYKSFISGQEGYPLVEIIMPFGLATRMCVNLLGDSEQFIEDDNQNGNVHLDERLLEAYDAIFNNDSANRGIQVGKCLFYNDALDKILETASLLSGYATYN